MSQEQIQLEEKTQKLLQGPLKHVRAAALAAALLPLASVAVSSASAQTTCPSGGICGVVFNDANSNGVQDAGEPGIGGAIVSLTVGGVTLGPLSTPDCAGIPSGCTVGSFNFSAPLDLGTYQIIVQIPNGTAPTNAENDGHGNAFVSAEYVGNDIVANFGFAASGFTNPGTGTPGYWKNHPEAWPVQSLTIGYKIVNGVKVGGLSYSKAAAIAILEDVGKDKRTTIFSSLVSAMLNVQIGNDNSCVGSTIDAANAWFADFLPMSDASKKVAASSYAWKIGEPLHRLMDNYNNGMLCAPHRD